jgi:hypothetical protein
MLAVMTKTYPNAAADAAAECKEQEMATKTQTQENMVIGPMLGDVAGMRPSTRRHYVRRNAGSVVGKAASLSVVRQLLRRA